MAICMVCGAGAPEGTARCASCGTAFAAALDGAGPAIGEVVEEGGEPAASAWGQGTVHRGRGEWLRLDRTLFAAPRALLLPTVLLLVLPVLLANLGEFWSVRTVAGGGSVSFGTRYADMLSILLTAFGAAWRATATLSRGTATFGTASEVVAAPLLVSYCWLLLLWLGVRREYRARRRGGALPTLRRAGVEAAWTGLLAGLVALLLAAVSAVDGTNSRQPNVTTEAGAVVWQAGLTYALAAALTAFAGWGGAALRARAAGRQPALLGWLAAVGVSARVLAVLFALTAVVGTVVQAVASNPWAQTLVYGGNHGLYLLGLGSGARTFSSAVVLDTDRPAGSYSLFDLGDHSTALWWTVLLPLVGALLLAYGARRAAFRSGDRAKLAAVHAVLTCGLLLASGQWITSYGFSDGSAGRAADRMQEIVRATGWSLTTVLVAAALWTALGALGLPALFALVRPLPEVPAAEPAAVEEEPVGAVLPDTPAAEPAPEPTRSGADAHAAYRRPGA